MSARLGSTTTLLALATLSIGSFLLVEGETASLLVGMGAVAIALAKASLILSRFMHVEWRHRPFAQVLAVWLVAVGLVLVAGLVALPWTPAVHASRTGNSLPAETAQ